MSAGDYRSPSGYRHAHIAQASFYTPGEASSISPPDQTSRFHDQYSPPIGANMPMHHTQIVSLTAQNPKRPYRQRRKDPSCDACRERKVKCDATETTSCTECSSRNVRCQFTKDTNRRMSSIKQVQDLERQLLEAKQQLEHYRANESPSETSSPVSQSASDFFKELPTAGKPPRRMLKAKTPQDLSTARVQLGSFARGLLRPPLLSSADTTQETSRVPELKLPSHQRADHLLRAYLEYVHRHFPVVYWPDFYQSFRELYIRSGNSTGNNDFISLLFAVLACGCQHTDDQNAHEEGRSYVEQAISITSMWKDAVTTTQATVSFLISKFCFESNQKSAAWIWAACAIRIVQDMGYHIQGGQWSVPEGEMRKRIWYSFYVWDRTLSLELGKPMLIDDDEFDTEYPDSLEHEMDGLDDSLGGLQPTLLLAAIHVARLMSPLAKLFRSLCITQQTIHKFEAQLYNCLRLLPTPLQLSSPAPLAPTYLDPILYFQNARLLLHRHNMSPACSGEQRSQAIGQCVFTAQDTASVISRTLLNLDTVIWTRQMALSASSLTCTHLWRCMSFLIFRRLYEPFFILLKAASAIAKSKEVNICCGRFLLFFIECLIERVDSGKMHDLEQDEELLVYLSGDLQSGTGSWVWGNAETGTLLSRRQKHGRPRHASQERETLSPTGGTNIWTASPTTEENQNWGGWQQIESAARHLQQLNHKSNLPPLQQMGIHLPPPSQTPELSSSANAVRPPSNSPTDLGRARMNIASII